MFSYLLTSPTLDKRYKVYSKTPRFLEETLGYALNFGPTSKTELLEWGRSFKSCLSVADNLLIAKAIALAEKRPGLFWLNTNEVFYKLPVYYLWPIAPRILDDFFETGFKTIASLQQIPLETLEARLGEDGQKVYNYCRGKYDVKIPLNPPFFEKTFQEKDLNKVLFFLKKELPHHTTNLWLSSEKKSIELSQDKIGLQSLTKTLELLFPWEKLTCLIWEEPKGYQGSLFDFSLPEVIQDLLDKESCLNLGISLSRRERVRSSNFIWGYESGSHLG